MHFISDVCIYENYMDQITGGKTEGQHYKRHKRKQQLHPLNNRIMQ